MQIAGCRCVKIPLYIFTTLQLLHVEQLFVFFTGSNEKYNISFNLKIIKFIKYMSCVILNSVMNDCYNSKNNHHFCFAPVHFFCQFAVLRRTCDRCILAYADLGHIKLASSFGIVRAINISPHLFQEKTQLKFKRGWAP